MAKAISISMETIVILAIAIIVLVVIVVFFTGSGRTLLGGMSDFISGTSTDMDDLGGKTKEFMLGDYGCDYECSDETVLSDTDDDGRISLSECEAQCTAEGSTCDCE